MFQSDKKVNSLGTILGPDIEFKGDINASGNIIIYGKIIGNINLEGDKSISHRALMVASICNGKSIIKNLPSGS